MCIDAAEVDSKGTGQVILLIMTKKAFLCDTGENGSVGQGDTAEGARTIRFSHLSA